MTWPARKLVASSASHVSVVTPQSSINLGQNVRLRDVGARATILFEGMPRRPL